MRFRTSLITSLLANVLLAGIIISGESNEKFLILDQSQPARGLSPTADLDSSSLMDPWIDSDYQAYYQALLSRGLNSKETKPLLLARLELGSESRLGQPLDHYWTLRDSDYLRHSVSLVEDQSFVRSVLVDVYGVAAENDEVFVSVFKPLNLRFPFLTSAQQVTIEKARLEHQVEMATYFESQRPSASPKLVGYAQSIQSFENFQEKLQSILSSNAFFEYSLRDSPLANQLRRSGVAFGEQEFRAAYTVLSDFQRTNTDDGNPQDMFSVKNELRRVLGTQKFTEFWAFRDPTYEDLQRVADRHQLPDTTLLAAYEILSTNEDQRIQASSLGQVDLEQMIQQMRAIAVRERRQLSELLGEVVATEILRTRSQRMIASSLENG